MNESQRILVIDDSEDDRLLYRRSLQKSTWASFEVSEAANGEDGLALIDAEPFACVLLDYSLPGRNGLEVLRQIRARNPFIPVVMLTGQGSETIAVAAMQEGAQNYFAKAGVGPQSLDHMIQVAIQHCAMQNRISKQHNVEAELHRQMAESNEELQEANDRLQRFTSIVSHDLRAPLHRVEAFAAIIREDYSASFDEEGFDLLHRMEKSVQRMKMMLSALLNYSKCSRTALHGKSTRFDTAVADAMSNFDLATLDVRALSTLDDDDLIRGDTMLIAHVFQNLISNAIKFHGADPLVVQISAARVGDEIEIAFTDNGIGIEAEFAEKVFEMFYRLHDEESYEGTGIGLTVCQKIVNDHDGTIRVDTGYRGGTKIVMTLPSA